MSVIPVKLKMYPILLNDVEKLTEDSKVKEMKSKHCHDYNAIEDKREMCKCLAMLRILIVAVVVVVIVVVAAAKTHCTYQHGHFY
jgi:hypothetical protein